MAKILMYTTPYCPYCMRARQYLDKKEIAYDEIDVSNNPELRKEMIEKSGGYTVPQIFINEKPIGGCDEMFELAHEGELEDMLNS